jgi:hypothetical protein
MATSEGQLRNRVGGMNAGRLRLPEMKACGYRVAGPLE